MCGACNSISDLSLKFIVHKDELNEIRVKNFTKLYGRGLIIAHLLLKNQIPIEEYLLFTFDYLKSQDEKHLAGFVEYYHTSTALGIISTKYIQL
jgi:hypothetical protein